MRAIPPETGAVVMGLGVVALDSRAVGLPGLSWLLFALAAAVWLVVAVAIGERLLGDRPRWRAEASRPGALTLVASTGVLGLGAAGAGAEAVAIGLFAVAVVAWGALVPRVFAATARLPVVPGVAGARFLLCVASQSVAALGAQVALMTRSAWLVPWCAAATLLGLVLYGFVLSRFDLRQVISGSGDHWVVGGALAISVVAVAKLVEAMRGLSIASPWQVLGSGLDLVLLAVTACWYLVLVAAECAIPRLGYDLRRWATVFPLGMTCAAGFAAATVSGFTVVAVVARVLFWPALLVLCLTGWGTGRRVLGRLRSRSFPE